MKWLLKYVNSTIDYGLIYKYKTNHLILKGFVDSDFAGDKDKRRFTSSYMMTLDGNCISWKSQLQPVVALSSTEAEYIAGTECFKEAIWLQGVLKELKVLKGSTTIYSDS